MDCIRIIELLSDFRDDALDGEDYTLVRVHLVECPPCADVFSELTIIVVAAGDLRDNAGIHFPDENILWQRLELAKGAA
ncbi:MAG: zf-HC2 domain-containing protein [Pyrinomonadaceae bacterium]